MRSRNFSVGLTAVALIALAVFGTATCAAAQQEKVLHSFSGRDGYLPQGGLTMDTPGNLYGTTSGFGLYGGGTAFELTPEGGSWRETVLHNFGRGTDGANPYAGLTFDASGNLYGTTTQGGTYGWGTVFELTPGTDGTWTEKVLHSFNLLSEAGSEATPYGGVILDASGNLYGTTSNGGDGVGAVFELTPTTGGDWTESVLYSFKQNGADGNTPYAGLTFDATGNLYGTTLLGGAYYDCYGGEYGCGTVFELTPTAGGGWTEEILHEFDNNGIDGNYPYSTLVFDAQGNLYGTTFWGGTYPNCSGNGYGCGTVFELTPVAGGTWTEKILHNFGDSSTDGFGPDSSLIFDASGNLYGATLYGGASSGGTAFKLLPRKGGWVEDILHNFSDNGTDGYLPYAGLTFDASGNLYGTTYFGGAHGSTYEGGTVFKIKP